VLSGTHALLAVGIVVATTVGGCIQLQPSGIPKCRVQAGPVHMLKTIPTGDQPGLLASALGDIWFADRTRPKIAEAPENHTPFDVTLKGPVVGIATDTSERVWAVSSSPPAAYEVLTPGLDPITHPLGDVLPTAISNGTDSYMWVIGTRRGHAVAARVQRGNLPSAFGEHPSVLPPEILELGDGIPAGAAPDRDGRVWVGLNSPSALAAVDNSLHVQRHQPHLSGGRIGAMTASAGDVWLAEPDGGKLGEIQSDGSVREYDLPSGSHPTLLTAGIWAAVGGNEVAGLTIDKSVIVVKTRLAHPGAITGMAAGPAGIFVSFDDSSLGYFNSAC
jgi:hypothetical protein